MRLVEQSRDSTIAAGASDVGAQRRAEKPGWCPENGLELAISVIALRREGVFLVMQCKTVEHN